MLPRTFLSNYTFLCSATYFLCSATYFLCRATYFLCRSSSRYMYVELHILNRTIQFYCETLLRILCSLLQYGTHLKAFQSFFTHTYKLNRGNVDRVKNTCGVLGCCRATVWCNRWLCVVRGDPLPHCPPVAISEEKHLCRGGGGGSNWCRRKGGHCVAEGREAMPSSEDAKFGTSPVFVVLLNATKKRCKIRYMQYKFSEGLPKSSFQFPGT
jgi:hypothetical protein